MWNSNRMSVIIVLLFCLTYFHNVIQAQENIPWRAISIVMSNNGRHLAVKYSDRPWITNYDPLYKSEVWIYDLENLLLSPQYLSKSQDPHSRMRFSPNSAYFAVVAIDRLTVFNTENNAVILDLPSPATPRPSNFSLFSFSPDSKYIMSRSFWRGTVQDYWEISIWDIHTGQRVHVVDTHSAGWWGPWSWLPWLSPDWHYFLDWSSSPLVAIYEFDLQQGQRQKIGSILTQREILLHRETEAAFSPDSSLFALVTQEGEVQVYETATWTLKSLIPLHQGTCGVASSPLAFAHNHPWLAVTCDAAGSPLVWNYETNKPVFKPENFRAGSLEFTRDDMFLSIDLRRSRESSILVWNIEKDFEPIRYPAANPLLQVLEVGSQLHPNSELMAAIGPDDRVWIWNIKQEQLLVILPVPRQ